MNANRWFAYLTNIRLRSLFPRDFHSSPSWLACSAGVFFERAICSRKRHVETFRREEEMGRVKGSGEGAGREREEKTPARKQCESEKHPLIFFFFVNFSPALYHLNAWNRLPLIRRAWPLFRKWVADSNKTTKQSPQSKDSHYLKKNKLEFIIVFILTESQCNSPQLMKLQFKLQFILLNSSL